MKQYLKQINKIMPLGLLTALATGYLFVPPLSNKVDAALEDSPKKIVDEVWQLVNNEFVDHNFNQVDWQKTRQELLSRNYSSREEAYGEIRLALKKLGDRYTRFLDPQEFESLTNQTSGELSGIGIRMEINQETGVLTVVEPLANSPATKAGIKPGDKIIKIGNKPTALMTIEQASEEIRGEIGTELTLEILREKEGNFALTLTRAKIELPSVSYSLKQEDGVKIGYIKLDEFSAHAAEQMQKAIKKLSKQQASGFVLDLRGNPGGLLFASVDIARMWLENGVIVRTVDRKGGDRQFSANETAITNLPLIVLVDENSASASEILAGALKDHKRAVVVGNTTFGKGTVQSLHSLSDGSGLAVTISRYYPPSGTNINYKGIVPDIRQKLTKEQKLRLQANPDLIATQEDPQYTKAITLLKMATARQRQTTRDSASIR